MEYKNKYTKLYDYVMALDNSLSAKVILSKVISFDESGHKSFMTNSWLAKELRIGERQVRRYLTELERAQLIQRVLIDGKRYIKPGPVCPIGRTRETSPGGQERPGSEDLNDRILRQLNKKNVKDS